MAQARAKTWIAAEVLYADDLNDEFDNILDNALSVISPLTGSLDAGGNNITEIGELAFQDDDADASAVRRLRATNEHLEWHDRTGSWPVQLVTGGAIFGLTLSNNSGDATNDIDIAAGQAIDDTEIYTLRLTSGLTKRLDAAWAVGTNQGGLDTGSIADTTYHVYLIKRSDTGVTDVLFSTSATAPTMPTNYDFKRRIGSIMRASGAIRLFSQLGDEFLLKTPLLDINTTDPGTSAVTATLSVPVGIQVRAFGDYYVVDGTPVSSQVWFSSPDQTDSAASSTILSIATGTAAGQAHANIYVRTNTSAQIRYRASASDGSFIVRISTQGWLDARGRYV